MNDYNENDLDMRLSLMRDMQARTREITVPLFENGMTVTNKASGNDFDPVTQADIEGERALRVLIQEHCPDDYIEGEELPDIEGSNDWLWTLDPIDGTRGFVAGVPVWSTLIAVSYKGVPVLGLIDHPALNVSFWGAPGRAWSETDGEETPINSRKCAVMNDAILGCTEPLAMLNAGERAAYEMIRRTARFSRLGLDAYGYAMIATGRMDIIIEAGLKPCDVRALMPVVEGAGGKITNWHGGSPVDGGKVVAVGDASLLPELYIYLGRAMDG